MNKQYWLIELEMLIARFSYFGIDADITSLRLADLWGLYSHLSRLAGQ